MLKQLHENRITACASSHIFFEEIAIYRAVSRGNCLHMLAIASVMCYDFLNKKMKGV